MTKENISILRVVLSRLKITVSDDQLLSITAASVLRLPIRDSRLIRKSWSGFLNLYFELCDGLFSLDRYCITLYHLRNGDLPTQAAIAFEHWRVSAQCHDFQQSLTTAIRNMHLAMSERSLRQEILKPAGYRNAFYSEKQDL